MRRKYGWAFLARETACVYRREQEFFVRVLELMSRPAVSVKPQTPLKHVARLLAEHGITGVPVVENARVVGVVSEADIVADEQRAEDRGLHPRRWPRLRRRAARLPPRTAGEAMTSPAITVAPQTSAVGAAWLMTQHDVNRLPVVDGERLVGVVTRSDLVRGFARSDDQVRREIVEEVLPALGVSANDVQVTVVDGLAAVRGEVEDDVVLRCLPHAVRGVLGVVAVVSELTARHAHMPFDRVSERL